MNKVEAAIMQAQASIQSEFENITGHEIDPHNGTSQLTMVRAGGLVDDINLTLQAHVLYGGYLALEDLAIELRLPKWRA